VSRMVWDDTGTADYLVRWTMWMLQEHPWRLLLGSTWSSWSRSHSPLACSTGPGGVERSDDVAAARGLFWPARSRSYRAISIGSPVITSFAASRSTSCCAERISAMIPTPGAFWSWRISPRFDPRRLRARSMRSYARLEAT